MMQIQNVITHQRGRGLFNSLIPSQLWPVVSTPVGASISLPAILFILFVERNFSGFVELLLVARIERVNEHQGERDHEQHEPPGLGEMRKRFVHDCYL